MFRYRITSHDSVYLKFDFQMHFSNLKISERSSNANPTQHVKRTWSINKQTQTQSNKRIKKIVEMFFILTPLLDPLHLLSEHFIWVNHGQSGQNLIMTEVELGHHIADNEHLLILSELTVYHALSSLNPGLILDMKLINVKVFFNELTYIYTYIPKNYSRHNHLCHFLFVKISPRAVTLVTPLIDCLV